MPQKLSSEAKSALEAFAKAQTADPREAITAGPCGVRRDA